MSAVNHRGDIVTITCESPFAAVPVAALPSTAVPTMYLLLATQLAEMDDHASNDAADNETGSWMLFRRQ